LEVLVQLVMAQMTTEPSVTFGSAAISEVSGFPLASFDGGRRSR